MRKIQLIFVFFHFCLSWAEAIVIRKSGKYRFYLLIHQRGSLSFFIRLLLNREGGSILYSLHKRGNLNGSDLHLWPMWVYLWTCRRAGKLPELWEQQTVNGTGQWSCGVQAAKKWIWEKVKYPCDYLSQGYFIITCTRELDHLFQAKYLTEGWTHIDIRFCPICTLTGTLGGMM